MILHTLDQRSPEWFAVRAGIPTASEFKNIITPLGKVCTGEDVGAYLAKKVAEKWLGRALHQWTGSAAEQGTIKEDDAISTLEAVMGMDVLKVGFITTDDGKSGCSPDAMFAEGTGAEFKSPTPETHVGYLLNGTMPRGYIPQVQGAMHVTGASRWLFVSYCPPLPMFRIWVARDEEFQDKLVEALSAFNAKMDAGYTRLVKINGGEPQRMAT